MQTVHEIERAIQTLSTKELAELYAWMEANCPQPIDEQLKTDLAAGRMDHRIQMAMAGHAAGKSRAL